ncbi:TPA: restriction endonuclease subunit S [Serratia liquefaciens]|nr:restriction endonuclease subunit S [Serratia liquefaciens]
MVSNDLIIPSHWDCKPLVDCTSNKNISYGIVQPGQHDKRGIGIIRVNNFENGELNTSDVLKVTPSIESKFAKTRLSGGEVLLTLVGSTGQSAVVPNELKGWNVARAVAVIKPSGEVTAEWLNICLQSSHTRNFLDARANTTVQKTLNLKDVKDIPIPLPPKDERDELERIAVNLNKKITLNRQINHTLEQMAQSLFKSWFVDFDPVVDNALDAGFFEQDLEFSDELLHRAEARKAVRESADFKPLPKDIRQLFPAAFEECSEPSLGLGGWVPEGWESLPVGSLIDLIGGGTPKTSEHSYWGGDIPWFSVVDAPNDSDVFVLSTEKKITDLGVKNSSTKVLRIGTTIISARGTVGKCALVATPMAMNQSCYGVIGTNGIHDYFIYYLIRQSVSQLQQRSHGSVFSTITRDTFNSFKFAFSGELIANTFGETISPWFEKIRANNQQRYMLQSLRDILLPKLISGELHLSDSEVDTAEEVLA